MSNSESMNSTETRLFNDTECQAPKAPISLWDLPPSRTYQNGEVKVWDLDETSLPESLRHRVNLSEWPNDATVSNLEDVLEKSVDRRFFLSPTACASILRRAENRGKRIPAVLKTALEQSAKRTT